MVRDPLMRNALVLLLVIPFGGCIAYVPIQAAPAYVAGDTCDAGFYVCPAVPGPPGQPCSCPGLGAPSFGTTR